ncbi:MAG: hypothetical protein WC827_00220 [Candidatus Paceibacterota bacterium]|jgi:hypothetical protein
MSDSVKDDVTVGRIIVDANGKTINRGSVVGMSDNYGPWSQFQGLVLVPYSEIEDDGYCVAVFFGTDVCPSRFNSPSHEVLIWDQQHQKDLVTDDPTFFFVDDIWKKCPRVVFFQPNELIVQESWNIKTLAERVFKDKYHTLYSLPKGVTLVSTDYLCFQNECLAIATRVSLWNVWGSVYPMHVCENCFSKTNGWCGDSLPEMKRKFLLANGSPVSM